MLHVRQQRTGLAAVRRTVAFGVTVGAVLLVGPLHAQYTRNPLRSVTGTVTDAGHEPLRGAQVQIEARDTLVIQTYVTDERGTYQFRNLRPDADFQIWATFRGNRSKTHDMTKFDRKLDREIPLVIELVK